MKIRQNWQKEVESFVSFRNILGQFTPRPPEWRYGKCVRCGEAASEGFDAYIPMCEGCKPIVQKAEASAEAS